MFRNRQQIITAKRHNFVLNNGALGDVVSSLPAIIYARQRNPKNLKMLVWAPPWQMDLIAHLLAPYGEFEVRDLTKFPLKALDRADKGEIIDQEWGGGGVSINGFVFHHHTRNRTHMVDFAFHCLIDSAPDNMNERGYPVMAPLGPRRIDGDYILIPTNATSENKLFRAKVMRPIIEWALAKGLKVVLTGTKTSHTKVAAQGRLRPIEVISEVGTIPADVLAQCVDMREATTLLELRDLCGYAKAVVGVDGGTIHLAGTTMAPIVYGLTTTHPKHRFIVRLGSPHFQIRYVTPRDLECAGCQSNWCLTYWDFTKCIYEDNECTYKLHPDDFIQSLKEIGV